MTALIEVAAPAQRPPSRRRLWIFAVLILVVSLAVWKQWPTESAVSRVKRVRVGQTSAEVAEIMGPWRTKYVVGGVTGECYGPKTTLELTIRVLLSQYLGAGTFPGPEQFPVAIEYDAQSRVSRIRLIPGDIQ